MAGDVFSSSAADTPRAAAVLQTWHAHLPGSVSALMIGRSLCDRSHGSGAKRHELDATMERLQDDGRAVSPSACFCCATLNHVADDGDSRHYRDNGDPHDRERHAPCKSASAASEQGACAWLWGPRVLSRNTSWLRIPPPGRPGVPPLCACLSVSIHLGPCCSAAALPGDRDMTRWWTPGMAAGSREHADSPLYCRRPVC
jgi:hypothetical protein